jgi:hypothetical protein
MLYVNCPAEARAASSGPIALLGEGGILLIRINAPSGRLSNVQTFQWGTVTTGGWTSC